MQSAMFLRDISSSRSSRSTKSLVKNQALEGEPQQPSRSGFWMCSPGYNKNFVYKFELSKPAVHLVRQAVMSREPSCGNTSSQRLLGRFRAPRRCLNCAASL